MTNRELIAHLQSFSPDLPVAVIYNHLLHTAIEIPYIDTPSNEDIKYVGLRADTQYLILEGR